MQLQALTTTQVSAITVNSPGAFTTQEIQVIENNNGNMNQFFNGGG
jgi:hypothetical protein